MTNPNGIEKILQDMERLESELKRKYEKDICVMFTDIKGSCSFFENFGDIEGRKMVQRHNDALFPVILKHGGNIVKTIGDAIMATFDSPEKAVLSAMEMQQALESHNAVLEEEKKVRVRIGINHGKALREEKDVYGDCVNLASRMEKLADAGEILVSGPVYDSVRRSEEIICRFHSRINVKGKKDPVDCYRVVWRPETEPPARTRSAKAGRAPREENDSIFILEASRTTDGIKISGSEQGSGKEATIRRYETSRVSEKSIEENCAEVVEQLNRSIKRGKTSKEILNKLQALGQNLLDEILTPSVKERLAKTQAKHLLLKIDDALVHIPWEILYDGKNFLCQRFCMGRIVSTRQDVSPFPGRRIHPPLRMLIMADPGGDLQGAYHEGINIRDKLEKFSRRANVHLKQMDVTSGFVREKIRQFDLVHFAGHGDYDAANPSNSGWLLKDGKFTAEDIGKMSGPTPFPALIFSNACHSGQTGEWKMDVKAGKRIFGLANAFLLAGVHHYIGTFWEIQDDPGTLFASKFYEDLLAGYSIGEAVKRAREHLISVYGEDGIVWAGYVLYGDPTTNYLAFADETEEEAEEDVPEPAAVPAGVVRSPDYSQDAASRTVDGPAARRFRPALGLMLALACLAAFWVLKEVRERDAIRSAETAKVLQKSRELLLDRERPREEELQGERLKEMIAGLAKKYREEKEKAPLIPEDQWTSRPLVISFLPLNVTGKEGLADAPLNIGGLFARRARIKVVERALIDKLIGELNLGASDLADPATALKLGRILGARFTGAGALSFFNGEYRLDLRVLETETTSLVATASSMAADGNGLSKMAEEAVSKLSDALLAQYPLRGKISSVEGGRIILNIGGKAGVAPGMKFTVYKDGQPVEVNGKIVDYRKDPVGEIAVDKAEAEYSEAAVSEGGLEKDMRVEEKH